MANDFEPYYPTKPAERVAEEKKEALSLSSSDASVLSVLDWLDAQIKAYQDPSIIGGANPSSDAEHLKSAILLAQGQIIDYKQKRNDFVNTFSEFIPEERRQID